MTTTQLREFVQEQVRGWLEERAQDMQANQQLELRLDETVIPRDILEEVTRTINEAVQDALPSKSSRRDNPPPDNLPDTTPPTVSQTDPETGAEGVAVDKTITVILSENIVQGDNFNSITLKAGESVVDAVYSSISGATLTIDPAASLSFSTGYTITVPAGAVKDAAGNPTASDYTFSFTTQDQDLWFSEIVDSGGDVGRYSSMSLAVSGTPHISYYDATKNILKYATRNGSEWDTVTAAVYGGQYTSIALFPVLDWPLISYYDAINGDLKFAMYNGDQWDVQTVADEGDVGSHTSLALPYFSFPSICYYDSTNKQIKLFPDGWFASLTVAESVYNGEGLSVSMDLDSESMPHIAYYDSLNNQLMYVKYNEATEGWDAEPVDEEGKYSYLKVDSSGNIHISYYDSVNKNLKYTYYNGSDWAIETPDSGGDVGQYTSLALDGEEKPHISYYDATNSYLKYAYKDGSGWHTEVVDRSGSPGRFSSIAVDESGNPRISYYSEGSGELKYAMRGIIIEQLILDYGYEFDLRAYLKAPQDSLPLDGEVEFSVDDVLIGSATLDQSGVAELNDVPWWYLPDAEYFTIKAVFTGTDALGNTVQAVKELVVYYNMRFA